MKNKNQYRKKKNIKGKLIFLALLAIILYLKKDSIFPTKDQGLIKLEPNNLDLDQTTIANKIDQLNLNSKNITLYNRTNKKIVYSHNGKDKSYPASITKVLTTLVALENIDDLGKNVTLPNEPFNYLYEQGASMAGFSPSETVTYRDLLYGTILPSGGEASMSLAYLLSESEDGFVELMNQKKDSLNMQRSNFTNTTGLHDNNHYSTTEDLVSLLDHALDNEDFKTIYTSKKYVVQPSNKNPEGMTLYSTLFSQTDDPRILGGKTGYTSEAGHCLSTYATIKGQDYILVTMNAHGSPRPSYNIAIDDASKIYKALEEF